LERQAEGPLSFYQRFLRITFRTFRCSCARTPTRICIRIRGQTHTHTHTRAHTRTYTRVLFPFCPPPRLRRPLVLSSFALHAVLLLPLLIIPHRLRPLRRYCTYIRMCVRAPRLNRRTRGFMSHGSMLPRREGGFVRG